MPNKVQEVAVRLEPVSGRTLKQDTGGRELGDWGWPKQAGCREMDKGQRRTLGLAELTASIALSLRDKVGVGG